MTRLVAKLRNDDRGATVVEFAFAMPILIIMIWMIAQMGLAFRAMAGIQHALGEGARLATVYPKPTNAAIKAKISSKVYGITPGTFTVVEPEDGAGFVKLKVNYTQPTTLLLLPGPTISVSREKIVWVAN